MANNLWRNGVSRLKCSAMASSIILSAAAMANGWRRLQLASWREMAYGVCLHVAVAHLKLKLFLWLNGPRNEAQL
jgi:hypothetical protein